jgi:hypothetical protein
MLEAEAIGIWELGVENGTFESRCSNRSNNDDDDDLSYESRLNFMDVPANTKFSMWYLWYLFDHASLI